MNKKSYPGDQVGHDCIEVLRAADLIIAQIELDEAGVAFDGFHKSLAFEVIDIGVAQDEALQGAGGGDCGGAGGRGGGEDR